MQEGTREETKDQVSVVIDNIRSAHNVGSIFRTSDAAGISQLYLCGTTPCPLDRFKRPRKDIAKVALGAEQTIPWSYEANTIDALTALKTQGFTIIALEQSANSKNYKEIAPKGKWAFVLGNEVGGISSEVLSLCDYVVEIPMSGKKESLNVSVAFGIAIFRLLNR